MIINTVIIVVHVALNKTVQIKNVQYIFEDFIG